MAQKPNTRLAETKRIGKFGFIGVLNTALDFLIYNLMFSLFGLKPIPANVVAASVAMTFSFFANKRFVFESKSNQHIWRQGILFIVITAFGLYGLQNIVIYTLTEVWQWPLELAYDIVTALNLDDTFTQEFVFNNGAKVIATVFSMVWNYVMYKKVVFKK